MSETRKLAAIMAVDVVGYSRLMGDEAGTAQAVRRCREAAIPIVAALGGRIVQIVGDGLLLEFPSVVAAVECAVAIQTMMVERNADTPEDKRIVYRIGVHLGDVLIDGDDILGEGVNIAARLESICEPGGVSISRAVYDQISGKLAFGFRTLGLQKLKNIAKAVEVFAIDYMDKTDDAPTPDDANVAQTIKYCRAPDGVRLAYAISGSGPFLVKSGNWMNHLEYDWESPVWRHVFRGLSRSHTLVRYDARGNGMSDWDVDTLSLDAWVTDLETVVDAVGVERFPLLGISQGGAVAVAYAVRNPERVSHLILYGAFALGGKKRTPAEKEMREAFSHRVQRSLRSAADRVHVSLRMAFVDRDELDAKPKTNDCDIDLVSAAAHDLTSAPLWRRSAEERLQDGRSSGEVAPIAPVSRSALAYASRQTRAPLRLISGSGVDPYAVGLRMAGMQTEV